MVRTVTEDDIGLAVLHEPTTQDTREAQAEIIDIVAIHGIGAHPDDTWCKNISQDPKAPQYVNWLKDEDMLPLVVPNARILRYGYESGWFGDNAIRQKVSTVAKRFLVALRIEREESPFRPLILIAHCFGGLVVLKALLEAQHHKDEWPGIFDSTTGLIFFGTPFRGAEGMKQSEMLEAARREYDEDHIQAEVLRVLEPGNEFLQDLVDEFCKSRSLADKAQVAYFYELKPSNVGAVVGGQARLRFVVNESSGSLDLSNSTEKYSLSRSHFNMNKFGNRKEEDFLAVCDVIKRMVMVAPKLLSARSKHVNSSLLPRNPLVIEKCSDPTSQRVLLDKISVYDHERVHLRLCRKRIQGTGQWFLEHPNFKEWLDAKGPPSLWCSGIIGSGKTMVATAVVDAAMRHSAESEDATVYFYCENDQRDMLRASDILASFIKQLLVYLARIHRPCPEGAQGQIWKFFGTKYTLPDFDDLADIAITLSRYTTGTIYIIDGLDELDENEAEKVLRVVRKLLGSKTEQNGSRIAMFSRDQISPYLKVSRFVPGTVHISTSNNITKDVQLYIETVLEDKMCLRELTSDPALMKETKQKLLEGASGMFLWVYLQIEALWDTCVTDGQIRQAIENLPKDLEETYRRCLERINHGRKYIPKVLDWISYAVRPLHIDELREAVAFDLNDKTWDSDKVPDPASVIGCCANLVVLDATDQCIRFAHPSVRQFLESNRGGSIQPYPADPTQGELRCGEFCVTYLSFSDFGLQIEKNSDTRLPFMRQDFTATQKFSGIGGIMSKVSRTIAPTPEQKTPIFIRLPAKATAIANREQYKFLRYAVANWARQTKMITKQSAVWELFRQLAVNPNKSWNFHPWMPSGQSQASHLHGLLGWAVKEQHSPLLDIVLASESRNSARNFFDAPIIGGSLPALQVASRLGFEDVVKLLLRVCLINKTDGEGNTAMHHSAEKGHLKVTKLLSDAKGAKADTASNYKRTPLSLAAINGHDQIVSLLIGKRAKFKDKDGDGRTPLFLAVQNGHEEVVKLLLDAKADVEAKDSYGQTALLQAAQNEHDTVVGLLLAKGAVWPSNFASTPTLLRAAQKGHEVVVKLLLNVNAPVEAKDSNGRTMLSLAAENGHEAVVKLLLNANTNVEAKDFDGRTALSLAAQNGHEAVVKLLLDAKADVEARDSHLRTALSLAAENGNKAVVKLLLDAKADVEAKHDGRTVLLWAAEKGHAAVVRLLLDANANVEAKHDGRTVLLWAAEKGHAAVVRLLLDANANVEAKHDGRTVLLWAAEKGHAAVVRLLLDANANVEAKHDGRTVLLWAAEKGHEAVVRLLLDANANVEAKHDGRTVLLWAAEKGHEAVVRLLLDANANVEAKYDGRTALSFAAEKRHEAVMKLLLNANADVEAEDNGRTALLWAAEKWREAVVKLLLQAKATVEAKDPYGWTALSLAAENGHKAVVKLLLEAEANVGTKFIGGTTLLRAARDGREVVVKLLLEANADVEAKDFHRRTALSLAAEYGHKAVVKLLLDAKADVEARDSHLRTALSLAAENGNKAVVKLLLDAKADVEARDSHLRTALSLAAENGNKAVVKLLLDAKADVEAKYAGRTALFLAAQMGHEAVMKLLLDANADVEAKYDSRTALLLAAENGHEAVVKLLLNANANVEAKDFQGRTALFLAAQNGHEAVVKLLLQAKATVEAKDPYGRTVLSLAAQNGHKAVVKLLSKAHTMQAQPQAR